jgi:hypothetical protein
MILSKQRFLTSIAAICYLLVTAIPAMASVVEYNSLSTFDAAAGSTSTITFDSLAPTSSPPNAKSYGDPGSASVGGDTFAANAALFAQVASNGPYSSTFLSAQSGPTSDSLTITTPGLGVYAIGLTYGSYFNTAPNLTIAVNGGTPLSLSAPTNSDTFVGFLDTVPITSIVLTETLGLAGGLSLDFDLINVVQGNTVTPIPAALPLFVSGLGALGLLGWRRKQKAAALAA